MLTIVAMGCSEGDVTLSALNAIKNADTVVVKSIHTHISPLLDTQGVKYLSCDDLYEKADDFDHLNKLIVNRLTTLAETTSVVFCVVGQGSDDSTVQLLGHDCLIIPSVAVGEVLLQYASSSCVTSITAYELLDHPAFETDNLIVKYIDNQLVASDVKVSLLNMFDYDSDMYVTDGTTVTKHQLSQLDQLSYSHLTTILVVAKPLIEKTVHGYNDLVKVVNILRSPNGCPWDRAQTHETIKRNCIEEAYELAHAIDGGDSDEIIEELGDVLLQVLLHNEMADAEGWFTANDVLSTLGNKLITRHPHVFGDTVAETEEKALVSWTAIKAKQHAISSLVDNLNDVPYTMTALMRANKVQNRARKGGYDFTSVEDALSSLRSEIDEFISAKGDDKYLEGGDLLFSAVNLLRLSGIDCETALVSSTNKFIDRVTECEKILKDKGQQLTDLTAEQFDSLWSVAKKQLK